MLRPGRVLLVVAFLAVPVSAQTEDLARKARAVLEANCYSCHGKDSKAESGVFILNRTKLVERRKLVPGKATESSIYTRMVSDQMPPDTDDDGKKITQRPSRADIALIKEWIDQGAPDAAAPAPTRKFVSNLDILAAIDADLRQANERDRKFLRYFTITHLYNAGLSDDELGSYRAGLSKLVNSLSWGRDVHVPHPIDAAKTIFRIDLRELEWDEKLWDAILAANPYGISYQTATAKSCYAMTRTTQPFVRADWFVFAASRPPLYHDVLRMPTTDAELEKKLDVDVAKNIRNERVWRAGFNGSGVSRNNRMIERHRSAFGAYWKSYDFGGNVGRQNLFNFPLGPGSDDKHFKHDGGEIIFNLPNGLQAYLLVDEKGKRIDKGPQNIVSDPKQGDRAVVNGVSCMSCHALGTINKDDQVRAHVEANPNAFNKDEADSILALYPKRETLAEKLKEDAERFQKAVKATRAHLSLTEPVYVLARQFENEIDLKLAAAEAGVTVEDFRTGLRKSRTLARVFGTLLTPGGTIQRDVLVASFGDLAKELQAEGTFLPGGQIVREGGDEINLGGGQKLVLVPIKAKGKSFQMGSAEVDEKANGDEKPRHEVAFTSDWDLGKFEVTVGQFKAFVDDNPGYQTEAEKAGDKYTWKKPPFDVQTDEHPVVWVSWNDTQDFCKWLSKKTGQPFRLPREAEWEYSCRAGTTTRYSFGDDEKDLGDFAWFDGNAKQTQPVGKKKPNAWELFDMHGNAWEWCEDSKREYKREKVVDPDGGAAENRVFRGGSYVSVSRNCRSAHRPFPLRDGINGFRVLRVR